MRVLRAPAVMAVLEGAVVKAGGRREPPDAERRHGSVGSPLCLNVAGDMCAAGLATGWEQEQEQEQKDGTVAPECSVATMAVWLRWASARGLGLGR